MKLPNSYGSVTKLSGKRRKPWIVRLTDGYTIENGTTHQNRKTLGYYKTRSEALAALAEYNKKPYDINIASVTFAEIYKLWIAGKINVTQHSMTRYGIMFDHSKPLHDYPMSAIRVKDMQQILDSGSLGYATQRVLLSLWSQMFDYALANDIVDKDYSAFVKVSAAAPEEIHKPFTEADIDKLWENLQTADLILILIYTGFRCGELLKIKPSDINTADWTVTGGSKTEAGRNRIVPIHTRIQPLITARLEACRSDTLLNGMTYSQLNTAFKRTLSDCGISTHLLHDTRHTFATRADNYGLNPICIKRILGHADKDVTGKVYTHKDLEQLRKNIELLP